MYELLKKKRDGLAKRGRFTTVHGTVETPVFMNVGTAAAIKGAVSTDDLGKLRHRWELPIPTISTSSREMRLSKSSAACTSLWCGTSRY